MRSYRVIVRLAAGLGLVAGSLLAACTTPEAPTELRTVPRTTTTEAVLP